MAGYKINLPFKTIKLITNLILYRQKIIMKFRKQLKIPRKEPMHMKKSADKLAIAYVIILSLIPVLALPNLIFQNHVLDAIPYDASALTTELGFFLSNLPAIIYIMVLYILGILNIWKSFSSYEEGDSTALINRMLIHKYGLVAFFLYDFILLFTLYFFAGAALTFMTGGLIIPLMLPIMSVMIFFTVIGFWLTILPGSFYALQVIRMTYKAGKISLGTAILHGILQLFFLADVLSAMYLTAVKWKRAKKSSIVVGIVYIVCAIGTVVLAVATIKEFQGL